MAQKTVVVETICDMCGKRTEQALTPPWCHEGIRRMPSSQQAGYVTRRDFCSEECLNKFKDATNQAWEEKRRKDEEERVKKWVRVLKKIKESLESLDEHQSDPVFVYSLIRELRYIWEDWDDFE